MVNMRALSAVKRKQKQTKKHCTHSDTESLTSHPAIRLNKRSKVKKRRIARLKNYKWANFCRLAGDI